MCWECLLTYIRLLTLNCQESCIILLTVRLLSANRDIFPSQCKGISHEFKAKETFFISFFLIVGKRSFLKGVRGSLPRRRKNGLSIDLMPRGILKLKGKMCMVSSQSSLQWMHFLIQVFKNEWSFLKCYWIVGDRDLKIGVVCLIQMHLQGKVIFELFSIVYFWVRHQLNMTYML